MRHGTGDRNARPPAGAGYRGGPGPPYGREERAGQARSGSEPRHARSALGLRLLLSVLFTPLFAAATAVFAVLASRAGPTDAPGRGTLTALAVACGVLAFLAAVDLLVVVVRRRRRGAGP